MKPLKAEMKEQGVVMIYIAEESSPKARWLTMLPDIGGIHYRLTAEQWSVLRSKYQIPGFPTYMIFDKTGEKAFRTVGFPGNDRMREELAKVW
jgi:thioredoxin-related protein